MADMTATQISDLRLDLADIESAFSDAELNRLWERCADARDDNTRFEATKGLVVRALLHNAAKFNDYSAGMTKEQKSQVYKHYKALYDEFYADAVSSVTGQKKQVQWAMLRDYPHQTRTEPND